MSSLTCLGTSNGVASAVRFHASYLLSHEGRDFIFDAGEPIAHSLEKSGRNFREIERIFISHLHSDHCGGLPMLLQTMWLAHRKKPLTVHLPQEGIELYEHLLPRVYLFPDLLPFRIAFAALVNGEPYHENGLQVQPFRTTHLDDLYEKHGHRLGIRCESFGFKIRLSGRKTIIYSGDLGSPDDLLPVLEKPVDLLVVECAHYQPEDLFMILRGKPIRKVLLTHLGPEQMKKIREQNPAEAFGLEQAVEVANDGTVVEV